MTLYLKLKGQQLWFCGWQDSNTPILGMRADAIIYHTEELIQGDYWSLLGLGCKVLIVRDTMTLKELS